MRAHRCERTDERLPCRDCGLHFRLFWSHRSLPGYWRCTDCYSNSLTGPERGGWKASPVYRREMQTRVEVAA